MDNLVFFLKEGLYHVLDWNAYDHILFLITLTVVYDFKNWKKVLWLITLFTLGHTLTLILSSYKIITINSDWIEFLIPITIIITAIFNIVNATKNTGKNPNLFLALFFGLIHGLGFSGYFKMIIGKSTSKLIPLLEFALGIEIAQIIVVFIILILGFIFQNILRFSKRDWIIIVSSFVIGVVTPILRGAIFW